MKKFLSFCRFLFPHRKAYLSLGSNLGDRESFLRRALEEIRQIPYTTIIRESSVMDTDPMDILDQPRFLNQVVEIITRLTPIQLLDSLQSIENRLGRVRIMDKGPRTIDIDILTFADRRINTPRLVTPHHSIESRPFIGILMGEIDST